ncbi:MAG: phospholipid carrier-dependent glycosyltransferase, partial [Candidatus Microgenomates bacterium]
MKDFIKKYKYLLLVFLLAFVLRVYKLGTFPVGFQNDEVKVGWNALSILKTGKDDRGNRFALYYNSFGDYRPTGIFYIDIPSIALLGRNVFAVRFPSALLGALSVISLFLIVLQISKKKNLALIAALLLAISPWHISTSRATSEVVISLFFTLCGLYLFLKYFSNRSIRYLISSIILLAISYFFYPAPRILIPLFTGAIIIYYCKWTRTVLVSWGGLVLLAGILTLNPQSRGRFTQVSIFNDLNVQYELTRMPFEEGPGKVFIARLFHNKPIVYARYFVNEYANYFSADFFLNPDVAKPARYATVGVGILTYVELGLLILGLISIAQ